MAEKIIVAGTIEGEGYDTNLEYNRRVYATEGIAPAARERAVADTKQK